MIKQKLNKTFIYNWLREDLYGEYTFKKSINHYFVRKILRKSWNFFTDNRRRRYIISMRLLSMLPYEQKQSFSRVYVHFLSKKSKLCYHNKYFFPFSTNFISKEKVKQLTFYLNNFHPLLPNTKKRIKHTIKNLPITMVSSQLPFSRATKKKKTIKYFLKTLKIQKPLFIKWRFLFKKNFLLKFKKFGLKILNHKRLYYKKLSFLIYKNMYYGKKLDVLHKSKVKLSSEDYKKKLDMDSIKKLQGPILFSMANNNSSNTIAATIVSRRKKKKYHVKRKEIKVVKTTHTLRYFNLLPTKLQNYKVIKQYLKMLSFRSGSLISICELYPATLISRSGFFENIYITNNIVKRGVIMINNIVVKNPLTVVKVWDYVSLSKYLWWYAYARMTIIIQHYKRKVQRSRVRTIFKKKRKIVNKKFNISNKSSFNNNVVTKFRKNYKKTWRNKKYKMLIYKLRCYIKKKRRKLLLSSITNVKKKINNNKLRLFKKKYDVKRQQGSNKKYIKNFNINIKNIQNITASNNTIRRNYVKKWRDTITNTNRRNVLLIPFRKNQKVSKKNAIIIANSFLRSRRTITAIVNNSNRKWLLGWYYYLRSSYLSKMKNVKHVLKKIQKNNNNKMSLLFKKGKVISSKKKEKNNSINATTLSSNKITKSKNIIKGKVLVYLKGMAFLKKIVILKRIKVLRHFHKAKTNYYFKNNGIVRKKYYPPSPLFKKLQRRFSSNINYSVIRYDNIKKKYKKKVKKLSRFFLISRAFYKNWSRSTLLSYNSLISNYKKLNYKKYYLNSNKFSSPLNKRNRYKFNTFFKTTKGGRINNNNYKKKNLNKKRILRLLRRRRRKVADIKKIYTKQLSDYLRACTKKYFFNAASKIHVYNRALSRRFAHKSNKYFTFYASVPYLEISYLLFSFILFRLPYKSTDSNLRVSLKPLNKFTRNGWSEFKKLPFNFAVKDK